MSEIAFGTNRIRRLSIYLKTATGRISRYLSRISAELLVETREMAGMMHRHTDTLTATIYTHTGGGGAKITDTRLCLCVTAAVVNGERSIDRHLLSLPTLVAIYRHSIVYVNCNRAVIGATIVRC